MTGWDTTQSTAMQALTFQKEDRFQQDVTHEEMVYPL
jgi:hypothetical protein